MAKKVNVRISVSHQRNGQDFLFATSLSDNVTTVKAWYEHNEFITVDEGVAWFFIREKADITNTKSRKYAITCDGARPFCGITFVSITRSVLPTSCDMAFVSVQKTGVKCSISFGGAIKITA